MNLLHVGVIVAEGAVLVFDLDGDDGAAIADLQGSQLFAEAKEPAARRLHEFWVGAAHDDAALLEQPCRVTAPLPLGADVGAGAQDHVEAFLCASRMNSAMSRWPEKS